MPRVRPHDFYELRPWPRRRPEVVWARWWRHRDGTVTHRHYRDDGSLIETWRRDPECDVFEPFEVDSDGGEDR